MATFQIRYGYMTLWQSQLLETLSTRRSSWDSAAGSGLSVGSTMRWTRSHTGWGSGGSIGSSTRISGRSCDTISHAWLIRFIEHRIDDRRIVRLIRKWLAAGVLEEGRKIETVEGTPQGAVISPNEADAIGGIPSRDKQ